MAVLAAVALEALLVVALLPPVASAAPALVAAAVLPVAAPAVADAFLPGERTPGEVSTAAATTARKENFPFEQAAACARTHSLRTLGRSASVTLTARECCEEVVPEEGGLSG